jgi:hypothetical protein
MSVILKEDKFVGKPISLGQKLNIDDSEQGNDFAVSYANIGFGAPGGCCPAVSTIGSVSQDVTKKLDNFIVKINKMTIRSRFGVWIGATSTVCPFEDPPSVPCPDYLKPDVDTDAGIHIGISPAGGLSSEEILRQTLEMGGPWIAVDNLEDNSYEIDISKFVPQPRNSNYTGNLVVTFYWGNTNYYWYNAIANGLDFTIIQKDQEYNI